MHNAAFAKLGIDALYSALAVEPSELGPAIARLRSIGPLGASITVPHKTAVIEHCDEITPAAKSIGAVNTLEFRDDGSICGHNTDAPGYVRALHDATGILANGLRVVLLGGGGAARAVAHGLAEEGADLRLIARSPSKVEWMRAEPWQAEVLAECLPNCDLLVDCTSMGLDAKRELTIPSPIPLERMPKGGIVSTLVYHRETKLLSDAKALRLERVDGSGMLLFQGVIAFELWTGQSAPVEVMRAALL
jgi:shikimate dehydrogenase